MCGDLEKTLWDGNDMTHVLLDRCATTFWPFGNVLSHVLGMEEAGCKPSEIVDADLCLMDAQADPGTSTSRRSGTCAVRYAMAQA